jgi:hypothetical protein
MEQSSGSSFGNSKILKTVDSFQKPDLTFPIEKIVNVLEIN